MRSSLASLTGALFLLGATHAWAECKGEVLFDDQFEDDLSGLVNDTSERIEGGRFIVVPERGRSQKSLLTTFQFSQKTLCIEAAVESRIESAGTAGILFWAKDYQNMYQFTIGEDTDGELEVVLYKMVDGESIISFAMGQGFAGDKPSNFEIGPEKVNTARIDIDGTTLAFSVNGKVLKKLRAQRPGDSLMVGLIAGNMRGDVDPGEHAFHSLLITDPAR